MLRVKARHTSQERQMHMGRGFTLIEALAGVLVAGVVGSLAVTTGPREDAMRLKDSSQVRGIHQSMVIWALQTKERFPLPSEFDREGNTVDLGQRDDPSKAFMLDSTRNIFSMLVFNGSVPVEMFVSPAETGPITQYEDYEVSEPTAAANPRKALWDPAFRATPRDKPLGDQKEGDKGSFSYAHSLPFGKRLETIWRDTFSASQAALGNRGASWERAEDSWDLLDETHKIADDFSSPVGEKSNTLRIHGDPLKWEGNIAYQDNRVIFEAQPDPVDLPFKFASVGIRRDNVFANENDTTGVPDDESRVNAKSDNVNAFLRSYSDRISGSVPDDAGKGVLDVRLEIFYD